MANPISAQNNLNYAGLNGKDKYSPLASLQLDSKNSSDYQGFTNNRVTLLQPVFPAGLTLATPSWNNIIAQEKGNKPPLVVVSSDRSGWIKTGLQVADAILQKLNLSVFNNINDLRVISTKLKDQYPTQSPPIYCPQRLGPNSGRSVYVVVHFKEYKTYQAALTHWKDITVIGWEFKTSNANANMFPLTGFGASRYAAIEFCKHLRTQANNPWDFAWLFDDNVIGFTTKISGTGIASGPTFKGDLIEVENSLASASANVCAGFSVLPKAMSRIQINSWVGARDFAASNPSLQLNPSDGILQQAVLWNIAELDNMKLNFSPIFVASKEDVSLTNYFDATPVTYQFFNTVFVVKEIPNQKDSATTPSGQGAIDVNQSRSKYQQQFATTEGNTQVQYQVNNQALQTTLRDYIDNKVLPNGKVTGQMLQTTSLQETATCQAMEQVITKAVQGSFNPKVKSNQPNASYLNTQTLRNVFQGGSPTIDPRDV